MDCIGLVVSKFTTTKIVYQFGSRYDTAPSNHVLDAGDQLTVGVHSRTVLAYVDGFSGGAGTNDASPDGAYSPATT